MAAGDISHSEVVGTLGTGTLATIYTVPANRVLIGLEICILNVDTSTPYFPEVQIIPTGQSAGDRYMKINPRTAGGNALLPGHDMSRSYNPMIAAGGFIQFREAGGTANKLAISMGITLKEV